MNNISKLFLLVVLAIGISSCKNEEKNNYKLEGLTTVVNWTAYKTTAKLPVSGKFKEIKIIQSNKGNTPEEALLGADFMIPVSSIFSDNIDRNIKLKQLFFAMMDTTYNLTGNVKEIADGKGILEIKMNNVTRDLAFTYTKEGQKVIVNAIMDINDWNAQKALKSLNDACLELHKGEDGISKTWSEVALKTVIFLSNKDDKK